MEISILITPPYETTSCNKGVIKLNDIDKRYSNTNEVYIHIHEKDNRIKYFIKLLEKKGFIVQEGSFNLAIPDNYEGILQDVNVWIDNRDTVYIKSEKPRWLQLPL